MNGINGEFGMSKGGPFMQEAYFANQHLVLPNMNVIGQARQEKTAISTGKPVYISSSLIISCKFTRGRRSRKNPHITRVPGVQKPNFPREIQTGKLDESSATKLP